MQRLNVLIATLCLTAPLFAQDAKPAAPAAPVAPALPPLELKATLDKLDLKDGDTMVFLGDSITHQCLYTQYVEDYYYTRFPDRHIHFYNSGVGGDRAIDALTRFDEDLAKFKPKYVSILLGMNDGGYSPFNPDVFATYEKNMKILLDRIAGIGATAVPMTPTMFDARASRMSKKGGVEPKDTFYNATLAYYGAWVREQASVRGLGFVDMYSPLNNLTTAERKKNPKFTMIPDAVHPAAPGQVVMALAVIDDMAAKSPVSAIYIGHGQGKDDKPRLVGTNGKITDFEGNPGGDRVSFNFKANALPWVLPAEAADGYKLTHAGHRVSNEKLTVTFLKPGNYVLKIDGQAVSTNSSAQFAFGVELEENSKTPQYQQALKVAMLNRERNDKAVRPLRGEWSGMKKKRGEQSWLTQNATSPEAPARKEAYDKWFAGFQANIGKFEALAMDYEKQIYQANQPVVRKYEITRTE